MIRPPEYDGPISPSRKFSADIVARIDKRQALIAPHQMPKPTATSGQSYAALRKACLDAVRQWPGCETISGIQIIRQNDGGFSVRVTLYGSADQKLADRAMRAVEREMRRSYHLMD
jgi:hypothetical protein